MNRQICILPTAPMRAEPSHRSEMVNQLLFGDEVEAERSEDGWVEVCNLYDGYHGWVDERQLTDAQHIDHSHTRTVQHPLEQTEWHGRRIWMPGGSVVADGGTEKDSLTPLQAAAQYIGAPYLWGGRTVMGIDCSGLMQVAFKIAGITLPRDASQQAEKGRAIHLQQARAGDLAFFSNEKGHIVHVGMVYTERPLQIIHASGCVRIDLLDSHGIFNTDRHIYSHTLHSLRRI